MDSACILACVIEKVCSQYDENLVADNVCSKPCSHLVCPGLPPLLQLTSAISVSPPSWPLLSQKPGAVVKGKTWSPASSSAFVCVASLTVCRTAAAGLPVASCGFLWLPLPIAILFKGSVSVMSRAVAFVFAVADAGTSTSVGLCFSYEVSYAYRTHTSTVTCTCNFH